MRYYLLFSNRPENIYILPISAGGYENEVLKMWE